ncbi:MAG TPA: phosphoribosyltransferase family protein [Solirubrobacteraceae bacterium]
MSRTAPNRIFRDRREAGVALGAALLGLSGDEPVVLALPRGGVPVAYEIARALHAPLDVLLVRKVGAPGNPELGMGAVAEGGVRVLDRDTIRALMISAEELDRSIERATAELAGQLQRYRGGRAAIELAGRTAIVVDDGLATGGTASAALRAVRARGARRVVLAVPVGSPQAVERLRPEADDVVCLNVPADLRAVGAWYRDFGQTSDAEVAELLDRAAVMTADPPAADDPAPDPPSARAVEIPATGGVLLAGDLRRPPGARGLVIFAHGSGSSRHSPRNRHVAELLGEAGLATLLIDLLTPAEERDRSNVFDIALLARRLGDATRWAAAEPDLADLPVGYFGASTGGGAALVAAAEAGDRVGAVVSRGGRPDLAHPVLDRVRAPTLLIVGGDDPVVLDLNREALAVLDGASRLAIVPGATHLFEEPGALDAVARLAADWFTEHLAGGAG